MMHLFNSLQKGIHRYLPTSATHFLRPHINTLELSASILDPHRLEDILNLLKNYSTKIL